MFRRRCRGVLVESDDGPEDLREVPLDQYLFPHFLVVVSLDFLFRQVKGDVAGLKRLAEDER